MGRIHLGTILRTTITLDFSFLILIVFFVFSDIQTAGVRYALLWVPVLFISILFHELAHAAMIGTLGFGPSQVVLEGIGGVTINERRARGWQDLLISAAGPASSFLLAWLIAQLFVRTGVVRHDPFLYALLPLLMRANIWWGIFNLLPVMPLDGSGIVRNFLRMFLKERTAFVIAVWVSMIAGTIAAIVGLLTRWIFLSLLMLWYVRSSYLQWQFFRSTNRSDD
jgi:stage IV sporulation protein FB